MARFVTVKVGDPEETASVKTLPPLAANVQFVLAGVAGFPNSKLPMLRDVSSVTVRFVVMLTVLKSAAASVPLPTMPFSQLVVTLQTLLASLVHVPLCARETAGAASRQAHAASAPKNRDWADNNLPNGLVTGTVLAGDCIFMGLDLVSGSADGQRLGSKKSCHPRVKREE
jgi:hypothetical protein